MEKIEGVIIKELKKYHDDRGWLQEIYRLDEDKYQPVMSYLSYTKYNVIRGPHEHVDQTDFFVFIGPGDYKLYLWDNRKDSSTYGNYMEIVVGESNQVSVSVPPGVVHGYKSISESGSFSINLPDRLFKGEGKTGEIDEIRHEEDPNSKFKIPR
ncbi:dTDP-4-dehydrorhamnose 3,5-epimerase family protein [Candidatus Woesearchaeota archaeon]|nr:dTDP-4-dehydrorhamnose 3,5-epimerase family protein [Candidatus Woesearchaeota archaeon]